VKNDAKKPLEEGKVIALRSRLPAHFNTPKVIQAYTGTVPETVPVLRSYKEPVRCKTVGKTARHLILHMHAGAKGVEFKISSPQGWERPVSREAIMKGFTDAGKSDWATVSLGTQNVHLERHELLAALNRLEANLKPPKANQG
jgi:hypothetical protein